MSKSSFQNIFDLKSPTEANFGDIMKLATMFIKTAFKASKKV